MKRVLSLLLIAIMSFSTVACAAKTQTIMSLNYTDFCDVEINYYIKNEEKTDTARTADGEVFITITPKDVENTTIEHIKAKVSADNPWSIVGDSEIEFIGYDGSEWMAKITLKANSALVNTSLKLNSSTVDIEVTSIEGEYKGEGLPTSSKTTTEEVTSENETTDESATTEIETEGFVVDEEELKEMVAIFGDGDGSVHWDESSFPYFMENRENFELIDNSDSFMNVTSEKTWKAVYYSAPQKEISVLFNSDGTANYTENGNERVNEWSYSENLLNFTNRELEARKINDNTLMLYNTDNTPYTPCWLLVIE